MDQHTMKVSDLYDIAIFDISRDGEQWRKYLEFSARGNLYRFDFFEYMHYLRTIPGGRNPLGIFRLEESKALCQGR